jgi:hypothetical protein
MNSLRGTSGAPQKTSHFSARKMKLRILGVSAAVIFILALSLSVTKASPKSPVTAAVPAAASQPASPAAMPEPHLEIRGAIASLRRAKARLEHAAHDFDGHRVEAIKATDEAIRQLQDCPKIRQRLEISNCKNAGPEG